jgi:hypothetical protein
MRKGWITLLVVTALTLVASVGWVGATGSAAATPLITDGRVNAWDIGAPVIVYCIFDSYSLEDGTEISDLQAVNLVALRYEGGSWENVVSVSAETLTSALAEPRTEMVLVDSNEGYSLFLNADDSLTAAAPGYSFNWSLGDQDC